MSHRSEAPLLLDLTESLQIRLLASTSLSKLNIVFRACKAFSKLASNEFFAAWFRSSADVEVCELADMEQYNLIRQWKIMWFCYWDRPRGPYGMPQNPDVDYNFRPSLELAKSGFVRTKHWALLDVTPALTAAKIMGQLLGLAAHMRTQRVVCNTFGSESDAEYLPMLLPWDTSDGVLGPRTLLQKLGAHQQLRPPDDEAARWEGGLVLDASKFGPVLADGEEYTDPTSLFLPPDPKKAGAPVWNMLFDSCAAQVKELLTRQGTVPTIFYAGSSKLNPIPAFLLAPLAPGLVGGFVTHVAHT